MKIDTADARKNLADLVLRASRGERITITRYGKEMAMLVPFETEETKNLNLTLDYMDHIQQVHDAGYEDSDQVRFERIRKQNQRRREEGI